MIIFHLFYIHVNYCCSLESQYAQHYRKKIILYLNHIPTLSVSLLHYPLPLGNAESDAFEICRLSKRIAKPEKQNNFIEEILVK